MTTLKHSKNFCKKSFFFLSSQTLAAPCMHLKADWSCVFIWHMSRVCFLVGLFCTWLVKPFSFLSWTDQDEGVFISGFERVGVIFHQNCFHTAHTVELRRYETTGTVRATGGGGVSVHMRVFLIRYVHAQCECSEGWGCTCEPVIVLKLQNRAVRLPSC